MQKIRWCATLPIIALMGCFSTVYGSIIVPDGAFSYSYNAGSDIADPNASLTGTSFYIEDAGSGNAAYFATSTSGSSGDVTYQLQPQPGYSFSGNLSTQEVSLVAFNPGGSVTETVTPNVGPATTITLLSASDGGFYTDDTQQSFPVNNATFVTIDFHLVNPSSNAIFTQVFRETNGTEGAPFTVSGTTVAPEPSSLVALGGLGAIGLLMMARRLRKA